MEKFIVTTGKTIDLAVAAALKELNLDRDNVSVEVLENAKSGFLGIGASPAKVKVTYEVPDKAVPETPLTALSSASRSKPKKPAAPAQEKAAYSVARWVFGGANPKFSAPKAAAAPASRAPSHLPGAYPAAASAGSSTDRPAIRETRVAASPAMAGKCRASASQAR